MEGQNIISTMEGAPKSIEMQSHPFAERCKESPREQIMAPPLTQHKAAMDTQGEKSTASRSGMANHDCLTTMTP